MNEGPFDARLSLFDALDFPVEAQELQSAYWRSRHAWNELNAAYNLVLADILHGPRSGSSSEAGSLPDTKEGRSGGHAGS